MFQARMAASCRDAFVATACILTRPHVEQNIRRVSLEMFGFKRQW